MPLGTVREKETSARQKTPGIQEVIIRDMFPFNLLPWNTANSLALFPEDLFTGIGKRVQSLKSCIFSRLNKPCSSVSPHGDSAPASWASCCPSAKFALVCWCLLWTGRPKTGYSRLCFYCKGLFLPRCRTFRLSGITAQKTAVSGNHTEDIGVHFPKDGNNNNIIRYFLWEISS